MPTLNWIGKDAVINHHKEVPFRLLKCRADLSVGDPDSGNLLVQGDNLEALKALLPYYAEDEKIVQPVTAERLRRVAQGYDWKDQKGNEIHEEGLGGGFRFCELGVTLFDPNRQIREEVKYNDLAQHVYFIETGQPLPNPPPASTGSARRFPKGKGAVGPLLGVHNGTAVYLLYNGILKDKSVNGGNVLTYDVLEGLPKHEGTKVIYGNGSRISKARLNDLGIVFKQIPYEIREM